MITLPCGNILLQCCLVDHPLKQFGIFILLFQVLYLDGVELFGAKQLQELVDLMIEKELRVQIPLEEVELLINTEPQDEEDVRHGMERSVTESLRMAVVKDRQGVIGE